MARPACDGSLLSARAVACWLPVCLAVAAAGCSRSAYLFRADADSYSVLDEKTAGNPWQAPDDYSVDPHPASRLFDPSPPDDPILAPPAPRLYDYELPELSVDAEPPPLPAGIEANGSPPSRDSLYDVIRQASYDRTVVARPAILLAAAATVMQAEVEELPAPRQPAEAEIRFKPITIPADFWQSIPTACLDRMLEFESVRQEFRLSHGVEPLPGTGGARRLDLKEIVQLALLNSREYQAEKERLYRAALRLTAERYEYDLKFSPFGNGAASHYRHNRSAGITQNTLQIPSAAGAEKALAVGGDLIARFANDVVLTFSGPSGFAADVGSTMLLDFSYSVFQRDIQFERLTQAERNVVYAARDFARFRKLMFTQLAAQYYNMLLTYRQVEIDSHNYFTLVRAYLHRQAELELRQIPRVQVDQVEQSSLEGRSSLIGTCNRVERSLDDLKLLIGIPTETPINLDLTELEQLTLRDEVAVAGRLVGRVRARLNAERAKAEPAEDESLNLAIELIARTIEAQELLKRAGITPEDLEQMRMAQARLLVDEARLQVAKFRAQLAEDRAQAAPPVRLIQRSQDLIGGLIKLISRQEQLARLTPRLRPAAERWREDREEFLRRSKELDDAVRQAIDRLEVDRFAASLPTAQRLIDELEAAAAAADAEIGREDRRNRQPPDARQEIETLLARGEDLLSRASGGLSAVNITTDDAMLTALVLRLDLVNQREFLGDDWRQIKLAADDLKSILNLNARQTVRTRSDVNRVFDFTWDESETRLSASLDTPLNRRRQRNAFRESLLDYQLGRRALMRQEDSIKLAVRNDLRTLRLTHTQYDLGIDSAALAYERVVSTELQLRLGVSGVSARDFLESQTAYTRSLSAVAGLHIGHILGRMQLFLDLELLDVNENGFWPQLNDERYQPQPFYQLPEYALPPYGGLPEGLHYSRRVQEMLDVPPGTAGVIRQQEAVGVSSEN